MVAKYFNIEHFIHAEPGHFVCQNPGSHSAIHSSKQRIKVAFFENRYLSYYGAQQNVLRLARNLDREVYEPILLTTAEGILAERFRESGLRTVIVPLSPIANVFGGQILRYPFYKKALVLIEMLRYNMRIRSWIESNGINVLFANENALLYSLLSRSRKRRLVWFIQAGGKPSLLSRVGIRVADEILIIARSCQQIFSKEDQQKFQRKIHVLNAGFAPPISEDPLSLRNRMRKTYGIAKADFVIGLVGSITHRKGHDLLIESAPRIIKYIPNAHFMIFGDSPKRDDSFKHRLQSRINELDISKHFTWTGFKDEIEEIYSPIDILALPSRLEGLPSVVIEVLCYGKPVVATNVDATAEIITSNKFGRLVPAESAYYLASAIIDVYSEETRDNIALKRASTIRQRFSIKRYVETFSNIIEQSLFSSR